jgi:cellulose synthase/poly-beta-1,6-N-acetylglucosamine synthase-like glycosyltransferase
MSDFITLPAITAALQWFFVGYFILLNVGYILLNLTALISIREYLGLHSLDELPIAHLGFEPPISLLVPAYNEQTSIVSSIRSLLQLDYPEFEIIIINDGSRDGTLIELIREFALLPFPEAFWQRLPTKAIRGIYRSTQFPNVRVIDKENGGKADALNAGINISRYPLICAVDADSILQRDSLARVVQPFLLDPNCIVSGGTIRIANGCRIERGFITDVDLPKSWLARFQVIEYLRAFLFGRLGWAPLNAVLIISGAFGLFRKDAVIAAGGYRRDTIGEDMELIVRLHRIHRLQGRPYRIAYIPDPICWTEAPETLKVLHSQRVRWQRGLAESMIANRQLLLHPRAGAVGWFAFPFFLFFEFLGPLIELLGYVLTFLGAALGLFSWSEFFAFVFVAVSFGILLSVSALLLEEMSFHLYPRPAQIAWLLLAAIADNLGYRQINSVWRLEGMLRWMFGTRAQWGEMTRSKTLHTHSPPP